MSDEENFSEGYDEAAMAALEAQEKENTILREEVESLKKSIGEITQVRDQRENRLREENARLRDLLAEGDAALSWVLLEGIDEAYPTTCPVEYARIVDAAKAIAAAIREGGKVENQTKLN